MYVYAARLSQQEKVISGAVAAGMHLMFLALLVFGVNWQQKIEPPVNVVDLWTSPTPNPPPPQAAPAPPPEPPPPPPVVKPEPKVVEPPVKTAPKPEVAKPDIAFKDKVEKEKRAVEEKQKEAKKKEEEAQAVQKAQAAQAAEAQRAASEQAEAQRRAAEQAAAAQAKLIAEYKERIRSKIQKMIILPQNLQGTTEAEFDVVVAPDGNPLSIKLKRTSGNRAYDEAVERGILRAQPLPMPPDPALLKYFRELNLAFRPQQ
jgi:colicin import membrane protein